MKKILLVTDYFCDGGSGKLVYKALVDLGVNVHMVDPKHQNTRLE